MGRSHPLLSGREARSEVGPTRWEARRGAPIMWQGGAVLFTFGAMVG